MVHVPDKPIRRVLAWSWGKEGGASKEAFSEQKGYSPLLEGTETVYLNLGFLNVYIF